MISSIKASNFRAGFVDRVVGDTAEGSRFQIEEQVLGAEVDVDLTKLAQFVFKRKIPNVHRIAIWKLLLSKLLSSFYILLTRFSLIKLLLPDKELAYGACLFHWLLFLKFFQYYFFLMTHEF